MADVSVVETDWLEEIFLAGFFTSSDSGLILTAEGSDDIGLGGAEVVVASLGARSLSLGFSVSFCQHKF